ncbi:MAG TPA: hypothetical protein VGD58_28570 [Herpetosiphonaceae bacterium]
MRIFIRVLVILVAALIVSGATFAFSRTGSAMNMGGPQRGQFERRPAATSDGAVAAQQNIAPQFDGAGPPEGFRRGGERGGGLFGVMDVAGKFLIIALIVAVVSFISRVTRPLQARLASRRKQSPPAATA